MTDESEHVLRLAPLRPKGPLTMELLFSAEAADFIRDVARDLNLQPTEVVTGVVQQALQQLRNGTLKLEPAKPATTLKSTDALNSSSEQAASAPGPETPKQQQRHSASLGYSLKPQT